MAINKDRSLSTRKQAVGRISWPNLPQPLLNSIARNPDQLSRHNKSWAMGIINKALQGNQTSPWFKFNSREINSNDAGCREIDPYGANKQFMRFTNIVSFEGKFYALSLQGTLAVVEEKDSGLVITAIGANRAVPSVPAKYFKEYVFESDGEILLAFLIYQTRLPIVDNVEVFRLNTCKLSWMKVESLQEKALFLENECCIWVKSRQVGCRGNCVYISARGEGNEWCIYDMETGSISPSLVAASLPWMNHYDSIAAM